MKLKEVGSWLKKLDLRNKLYIPFVIIFSYSLFFFLLLLVNPTGIRANGKTYLGLSALNFFFENWATLLILAMPIIAIYLIYYLLDKEYVEKLFSKEKATIFLTFIMVITLLFTLIQPLTDQGVEEIESEEYIPVEFTVAVEPMMYFSLIYLLVTSIICFLSSSDRIKSIFGISSILLVVLILFELMKLRYGVSMDANEFMTFLYCQTGWFNCKWFYLKRILIFLVIVLGLFSLKIIKRKL